jgi:hypothetical protein
MTSHPRRVPDWVRDIREAIEYIYLDMGGLDRQAFAADGKTVRVSLGSGFAIRQIHHCKT